MLINCFLILKPNGRISIKQWDASEASIQSLTDANTKSLTYDANAPLLINQFQYYFGWDGQGDEAVNFSALTIDIDATSQSNYSKPLSKFN